MGANEKAFEPSTLNNMQQAGGYALVTPPTENPPHTATPPPQSQKRPTERGRGNSGVRSEMRVDGVDPTVLSKALMRESEESRRQRDPTPSGSPSRKRQRIYGDR